MDDLESGGLFPDRTSSHSTLGESATDRGRILQAGKSAMGRERRGMAVKRMSLPKGRREEEGGERGVDSATE